METNNMEYVGRITTFLDMLTDENSRKRIEEIIIPKIQRDYAQGRAGRKVTREKFLKRLWTAIDSDNSKAIELDFIYGQKTNNTFLPIDGQQRLTTLFLLYLYLGKRTDNDVAFLKAFTYDTRDSSKEFCRKLLEIPGNDFRGIKAYIANQWWFTRRWSIDPTIASMMVMLDDIDRHYSNQSKEDLIAIWDRLTKGRKIKFWQLNLDDLKTSDDLYIKMNSRGKPLTDFEHFKAEIESYIHTEHNSLAEDTRSGQFSLKIDTVWTDLLWQYRDQEADDQYRDEKNNDTKHYADNGLDQMFINLFRRFMVIEGTKTNKGNYNTLENTDILSLAELILKDQAHLLGRFEKIMDFFASLENVNDFFSNILTHQCDEYRIKDGIESNAANYRVYIRGPLNGELNFFLQAAKWDKLNNASVLMLEAFFQYAATTTSIDYTVLREKIRIIRNLILNSPDELRAEKMGALLRRVNAIMRDEPLNPEMSGEFRQAQIRQEIAKVNYINSHTDSEWTIKFSENNAVLCGNLSCYMENEIVLVDFLPLHAKLFHADADYDQIERFLLTIGDYAPTTANGRRLYAGRNWENWRNDIFNHGNKVTPPILHKALQSLPNFDKETIDSHITTWLTQQENTGLYTWPYYMVRHAGMRHGQDARYTKAGDFETYDYIMMNKNNFNGKHWSPYLFCLSKRMSTYNVKLADYNAPLIFENEEVAVQANEKSFKVIFADGNRRLLNVPQTTTDEGIAIDCVDRIDWAQKELEGILGEIKNS